MLDQVSTIIQQSEYQQNCLKIYMTITPGLCGLPWQTGFETYV